MPVDINIADLKDYTNVYNNANTYFTPYSQNTWWIVDHNYGTSVEDRVYGKLELGYNFTKELKLLGRLGGDFTNSNIKIYNDIWNATYPDSINYQEASSEIGDIQRTIQQMGPDRCIRPTYRRLQDRRRLGYQCHRRMEPQPA
jgi:hypothetical protein